MEKSRCAPKQKPFAPLGGGANFRGPRNMIRKRKHEQTPGLFAKLENHGWRPTPPPMRDAPRMLDSIAMFRAMAELEHNESTAGLVAGAWMLTEAQVKLVLLFMADALECELNGRQVKVRPEEIARPAEVMAVLNQWFVWLCDAYGEDPHKLASIHAAFDASRLVLGDRRAAS